MISSNYFLLLISLSAAAPTLDISSEPATKQALSSIAGVLMPYYLNNNYAGLVKENESKGVDGFQWYEGGIFWGIMMEYVRVTGDTQYDSPMFTALATASNGQAGSFLGAVPSIAALAGKWNDDILWWGMPPTTGAMIYGPDVSLPGGRSMRYVANQTFAEVWNIWDSKCGGGLYWSRNQAKSAGYKSTITNVQQMLLGAQLTDVTKDQTYVKNADQVFQWLKSAGLLTADGSLYDGIDAAENCKISRPLYSYNAGLLLGAFGWMYKVTNQQSYIQEASTVLKQTLNYFSKDGIITDPCEPNCPLNSAQFKGALIRGLGFLYEFTPDQTQKQQIKDVLSKSVQAMLKVCDNDWNCGGFWYLGQQPAAKSVHDQMNAAELMTAYYKTFGIQMKSGITPPAGAKNATTGGNVGTIPQGGAGDAYPSLLAMSFTALLAALFA